ncbi:MAG: tRNA pseudouridine(13) synthase TruD [Candidatus Altiarchaeota archaeon]
MEPPELERAVGMRCYKSGAEGVGGVIKQVPEDFIVEEIAEERLEEEGQYIHFTLEKKNWDTLRAIKEISQRLRVSQKRLGFAGTKDRRAVTRQRVSVWDVKLEDLEKVSIKDIMLSDFSHSDDRINLGDLEGNRFSVTVRKIVLPEDEVRRRVDAIAGELSSGFPNYYGVQRFGIQRPITHLVGREILRGDFNEAVRIYLGKSFGVEEGESDSARQRFWESGDYGEAIRSFPKHLGYEHALLNHLVKKPTDHVGALRNIPQKLRWMFVHAYQSYVFNLALSEYIRKGFDVERLPLPGYETQLDEVTASILDGENVSPEDFKVGRMPELSSKGEYRDCFIPVMDSRFESAGGDELNAGFTKVIISFSLPKGCYATSLLREYLKGEYW